MAKKAATKRNPQDATLRNIRALKKRIRELEHAIMGLRIELDQSRRIRLRWHPPTRPTSTPRSSADF